MAQAKGGPTTMGTVGTFLSKGTCSQTLFKVLNCAFDHPLSVEERASDPLAGGIAQHGYQCGQLWGATLAAGGQACRLFGPGPQAETIAIVAAQKLVTTFRASYGSMDCQELTGLDFQTNKHLIGYLLTGGPIHCFSMAARFAAQAFDEINAAFAGNLIEAPAPPVSCAALVARKLGVSDLRIVMAAGLAGGIGLSGGACGALGAAAWIHGMNETQEKVSYKAANAKASQMVERFLAASDNRFECSEITGRIFKDVADHAGYLREGGCAKIIEALGR